MIKLNWEPLTVDVSLNRLPDRSRRRRAGPLPPHQVVRSTSGHPVQHLEIYGGVLFAVVTVLERRDSHSWLRFSNDDDDEQAFYRSTSVRDRHCYCSISYLIDGHRSPCFSRAKWSFRLTLLPPYRRHVGL